MKVVVHLEADVAKHMFEQLKATAEVLATSNIGQERIEELDLLAQMTNKELADSGKANLNFICTHNSRRSQFAQAWAAYFAHLNKVKISCYSGGVEVTECNPRTITALKHAGFHVTSDGDVNPKYKLSFNEANEPVVLFSKLHSDGSNPERFIAVMTCDHADQNCPFIPNAIGRASLTYIDPKRADNQTNEALIYHETSMQIATEMKYLFSQIA